MSGRNPPLYCTLTVTLIAMKGHKNRDQRYDEPGCNSILLHTLSLGSDGCQHYYITVNLIDKAGDRAINFMSGSATPCPHASRVEEEIIKIRGNY